MTIRPRNLTEQQFAALVRRKDRDAIERPSPKRPTPSSFPTYRSKLEAAFASYLDMQRRAGIFRDIWYEPVNLRLPGQKNFYKSDFLALEASGSIIFYEVKGYSPSNERSLVKIKTAAGVHTWARFILVKRIKGAWEERIIS